MRGEIGEMGYGHSLSSFPSRISIAPILLSATARGLSGGGETGDGTAARFAVKL